MDHRPVLRTTILLALASIAASAAASDFSITPIFTDNLRWGVQIEGGTQQTNPTLFIIRGQSYSFDINTTSIHPFWIKTVSSTGSGNAYAGTGLSANDVMSTKTITFDVPQDAPDQLFYNCGVHSTMAGAIEVVVFRSGFD